MLSRAASWRAPFQGANQSQVLWAWILYFYQQYLHVSTTEVALNQERNTTMPSFKITNIHAREIIDCRGWPTVQADVWVDGQLLGRADVASGRSTGSHEAYVLLDGD